MGMYTEIFFRAEVDKEAYDVICALHSVAQIRLENKIQWPEHDFFSCIRMYQLVNGESWYFPHANHFSAERLAVSIGNLTYHVSFRANLKNYESEVQKFYDWVKPHCISTGFIGYDLYEENTTPRLWFK